MTLRFVQGVALGGEWAGAVLIAVEHGDQRKRGQNASWTQCGPGLGHSLLHLLHGFDGSLGIAGEVHDQAGVRVALQVLHHADVEVGGHLLVFGDDLGVRQVDEAVAHHLAKMFVAGSDH